MLVVAMVLVVEGLVLHICPHIRRGHVVLKEITMTLIGGIQKVMIWENSLQEHFAVQDNSLNKINQFYNIN